MRDKPNARVCESSRPSTCELCQADTGWDYFDWCVFISGLAAQADEGDER
jgi:hypothetical protein